jgi:SAM-dependent methyltransferase
VSSAPDRLNLGCGPFPAAGWLNADLREGDGVDLRADIREGLPLGDSSLGCIVAMHLLQDLAWGEIPVALRELKRILRSGGVLRLGLPDLDRAIDAYRRGDGSYFFVPDEDAETVGAKLVTQIVWYGSVRTPFNFEFASEVLATAGFRQIVRCAFRETRHGDPGIVELDNRERESLFVEALG